jgi:hypothetical protein
MYEEEKKDSPLVDYFRLVAEDLLIKLKQVRALVTKHGPTIGLVTEEVVRTFLRTHLPKSVSVEQGFILTPGGELSRQCDIIIYDSTRWGPFFKVNDVVIVPAEAVVAVVEVKTKIDRDKFHKVIEYFGSLGRVAGPPTYLFIFEAYDVEHIESFLRSYEHPGEYKFWDHDTFQLLPDEIIGINESYHLKKDLGTFNERDSIGYTSYFFADSKGTEVSAIQSFYLSLYQRIHEAVNLKPMERSAPLDSYLKEPGLTHIRAIELFDM